MDVRDAAIVVGEYMALTLLIKSLRIRNLILIHCDLDLDLYVQKV